MQESPLRFVDLRNRVPMVTLYTSYSCQEGSRDNCSDQALYTRAEEDASNMRHEESHECEDDHFG